MDNTGMKQAIEAIIFVSREPVSLSSLAEVFRDLSKSDLTACIQELISEWSDLERGFSLLEVAGGYQFRTKPEFRDQIYEFNREIRTFRLSQAAIEVLTIVAYRQPITRPEIDEIRGVDSSGVVNLLLDRGFLSIRGRKEVVGRPFLYVTSEYFLEVFGLTSIEDLPTLKEFEEIEKSMSIQSE